MLYKYPAVFQEGLENLKGFKAKIYVNPKPQPQFHRARTVTYALRDKVETELKRLHEEETLEPMEVSYWSAPTVPVLENDNSMRLCGDIRVM